MTFDQVPQAFADLFGTSLATGQLICGSLIVISVTVAFMLAARLARAGPESIFVGAAIGLVTAVGIGWWPSWTVVFIGLIVALLVVMYRGGGGGDPGAGAGL